MKVDLKLLADLIANADRAFMSCAKEGWELELSDEARKAVSDAIRVSLTSEDELRSVRELYMRESARPEVEALLREARDELKWWIDNHGCCEGHEGDILKRIDERLPQSRSE